ncbi:MAG: hypothetical protein AABZ60_21890 [Planctomycetota bacterium]
MRRVFFWSVISAYILWGCSVPYRIPVDKGEALKHIIAIDRSGNFIPLESGKIVDDEESISYRGQFLKQQSKARAGISLNEDLLMDPDHIYEEHLDEVMSGIRQHPSRKILIFIHGGLNTLEYSISRAIEDYAQINDCYPVFINWHNGALDTYLGQAFEIRDGKPAPPLSRTTGFPFILTDLATAFVHVPKSFFIQLDHFYEGQFNREHFEPPKMPNIVYTGTDSPEIFQEIQEPLFAFKFFTAPLVDIFGANSWNNMRRRVYCMFRKPSEFEDLENPKHFILPQLDDLFYINSLLTDTEKQYMKLKGSGALAVFMERLKNEITKKSFGNVTVQDYEITLVGHSMGTIALNELIRSFPELEYKEIIFMAAACSIRDFLNKTVPYLQTHLFTKFYNLCLHPEAEDNEKNWLGLVPRGSLLAWIDNRYMHPETHLDRTMGRWSNLKTALHVFPQEIQERLYFKIFGFAKKDPISHGDFTEGKDDYEYWNSKFWNLNSSQK